MSDPSWGDVNPDYASELNDWLKQYEMEIGYAWIPDAATLHALATNHPGDFHDFSMGVWANLPASIQQVQPWAQWGMDHQSYQSRLSEYQDALGTLLGPDVQMPDQIGEAFALGLSSAQLTDQLKQDAQIQKQYGWIRYGYDYNSFQQFKMQNAEAFGGQLDDKQAVLQLQYLHSVSSGPQATGGQPSQQVQQKAQSGSVVR